MSETSSSSSPKFETYVLLATEWVRTHQEQFWTFVGSIFIAVFLAAFLVHNHAVQSDAAWVQLGPIQSQIIQGKMDTASKALIDWNQHYGTSKASSYAKFLLADLQYRTSDYATAAQTYGDLAQTAVPTDMRPLALSAQSSAEEMAGHLDKALALAQNFTDKYPDHFMAASAYMAQGRLLEMQGNRSAASSIYDRFSILFPQSPWAAFAKAHQQSLSGPSIGPAK